MSFSFLLAVVPGILEISTCRAAPQIDAHESYMLSQCAVVETGDRPRVYLTAPGGELEAVDALNGQIRWKTKQAGFALLARGDRLLATQPPGAPGTPGCGLVLLDARTGRVVRPVDWPVGGPPGCIVEGIRGSVHLEGFARDGRDYVRWTSAWWPMPGGAYRGPRFQYPPGSSGESHGVGEVDLVHAAVTTAASTLTDSLAMIRTGSGTSEATATFLVDGVTIQATREVSGSTVYLTLRRWRGGEAQPDVALGNPPWASCGFQFTADRRHALGVWQVPGASNPFLYHAEIFSVVTGSKLGAVNATSWPIKSQLCGSLLVAYFPNRVFAVDLASGRERWSRPLKDLAYRGTYPPAARPVSPQTPLGE